MKKLASALTVLGLLCCGLALVHPGETVRDLAMAEGDYRAVDDGLSLYLQRFDIPLYPSGKHRQYESTVLVNAQPGADVRLAQAKISVNHPLRLDDRWIYQFGYGYDAEGNLFTRLRCVKDPALPFAAAGGALLILGALAFCLVRRSRGTRAPTGICGPTGVRRVLSWIAALIVVALPVFIIGRTVMRPEPVPALQSVLMAPHVAAYAASYLLLLFAAFGIGRRLVPVGFLLMTLGLVIGALWGKFVWGEWWQYDSKECWSFATWIVFALHLECPPEGRLAKVFLWLGAVLIVLTLTWVNFSRLAAGLHSYA